MPRPHHIETDTLTVDKLCVGPLENNVYVVACARTASAIIIDAAAEAARIVDAVRGLDVTAIVTTHGHWDHVGALDEVRTALDVDAMIHPADACDITDTVPIPSTLAIGDLRFEALVVPGHTPGSTCIVGHGLAFTGDTLFPGGPGATSGPDAFAAIMRGLRANLFGLDDATIVLPGHGLDTTIGRERPHLDDWQRRGH